ncbi:hypothetical protein ACT3TS_17585 [Specibacter sp. AOP5-B1-6]|uniref:hypothetical protein n=1 Tax=Specibacter sp. AOP5-B1-6 TaxID=3457653 RepID=UPI003FB8D5DF
MSMPPPVPGPPEQNPDPNAEQPPQQSQHPDRDQYGQPQQWQQPDQPQYPGQAQPEQYGQVGNGWSHQQPQYDQSQYGQPQQGQQPQYSQPQYGQPQQNQPPYPSQPEFGHGQPPAAPYAQPYYGVPGGMPPAPKKKSVLPWVLGGGAVLFLALVIGAGFLVAGVVGGGNKADMVDSTTVAASFKYPEGWIENGQNVTIIKDDGSQPDERFNAINQEKDATALLTYEAGAKPDGEVTQEKIHAAIDQGFQAQLDATQEDLVYFRASSGFGCLEDFNYTQEPSLVERDGMYGYSYGYTCESYQGRVEGQYFVAYDASGVSHRMTVEALQAEWDNHKATLTEIIPSLKPAA